MMLKTPKAVIEFYCVNDGLATGISYHMPKIQWDKTRRTLLILVHVHEIVMLLFLA